MSGDDTTISDRYHVQRALSTGKPVEATILEVEFYDDLWVALELGVVGDRWYWLLEPGLISEPDVLVDLIRQCEDTSLADLDLTELVGNSVMIEIGEHKSTASLAGQEESADFRHQSEYETEKVDETVDIQDFSQQVSLLSQHHAGDEPGIEARIGTPEELDETTLRVPVRTGVTDPLTWEFEITHNTSPEDNSTARLIERLGGGEPMFIEDELVYLLPAHGILDGLNPVEKLGTDTGGNWMLMLPSDYDTYLQHYESSPLLPKSLATISLRKVGLGAGAGVILLELLAAPFVDGSITLTLLFLGFIVFRWALLFVFISLPLLVLLWVTKR